MIDLAPLSALMRAGTSTASVLAQAFVHHTAGEHVHYETLRPRIAVEGRRGPDVPAVGRELERIVDERSDSD